jgi:hypothetical protein
VLTGKAMQNIISDSRDVGRLCELIRQQINRPRKQNALVKDAAFWNMLCSSMDAVGDTELALHAYSKAPDPADDGARYLLIFGVLQVLFVQQDAVKNLAASLGIRTERSALLQTIREVRNDSVGHPTKRGGGRGESFNFISRATMSKTGFDLMTTYADKSNADFQRIDLPTLIADQRRELGRVLEAVLDALKKEEIIHKREFGDSRMSDLLPDFTRYALGKLAEAVRGENPRDFGMIHLEEIERAIRKFKAELERRSLSGALTGVEYTLDELEYPISEVRTFLDDPSSSRLNSRDASIFVYFISRHFDELCEMANEIDNDYDVGSTDSG